MPNSIKKGMQRINLDNIASDDFASAYTSNSCHEIMELVQNLITTMGKDERITDKDNEIRTALMSVASTIMVRILGYVCNASLPPAHHIPMIDHIISSLKPTILEQIKHFNNGDHNHDCSQHRKDSH